MENISLQKPWDNYPVEYINITQEQLINLLSVDEIMDIYLNFKERWNCSDNLPGEVWTYITEFDDRYSISCYGRLKRNSASILKKNSKGIIQRVDVSEKIINGYVLNKTNYPERVFREENCHYTIHRLVAKYFIKKAKEEFDVIDHKNNIKYCAHIFNLWWCNNKLNIQNPITRRTSSSILHSRFEYPEIDYNATENDKIDDYLDFDKLFSSRMFTNVNFYEEIWKYVQTFDVYVSNYGRIKKEFDDNSTKLLKQVIKSNYLYLNINGASISMHYLVLYAFGKIKHFMRYENDMTIDHINTNTIDNRLCNLRYISLKDNVNNELTKKHMSDSYNKDIRSIPVLLYDAISLKFIQEYNSISEAAEKLNISNSSVKMLIDKGCIYKYKWFMFSKTSNNIKLVLDKYEVPYYNRSVTKFDMNGRTICSYDNAYEIKEILSKDDLKYIKNIYSNCKNKKGMFDKHQWRYTEEVSGNINSASSHMVDFVKINMYDYDGNFIRQFNTSKEVAKYFNVTASSINTHINRCLKETVFGMYFRYTNNADNRLNLWDSGLFNNSKNAIDILNVSKENINVIETTSKIINVYDVEDGYIIKRYYSLPLCSDELNVDCKLIKHNVILCEKYYIVISENNNNFKVKIDFPKTKEYLVIDSYVDERNKRVKENDIIVYNYYTNEKLGEYNIKDAESYTGIKAITIINCCESVFDKAVNMDNLETYSFCYKCNEDEFEINKEKVNETIYVLYNVSDGQLYKIIYTHTELNSVIGYNVCLNNNKNYQLVCGKYILKVYHFKDEILEKIKISKEETDLKADVVLDFNNQFYRSNEYKILKFTLDGKFVESFDSFIEISKNKTVRNKIRDCANHITQSAYGFQWRFSTECSETDDIGKRINHKRCNYGKILKISLDGEIVETFENLYSIPVEKRRHREMIHRCALGYRNSTLGFKWKYEKDINTETIS